jgi:hypothetical protein
LPYFVNYGDNYRHHDTLTYFPPYFSQMYA